MNSYKVSAHAPERLNSRIFNTIQERWNYLLTLHPSKGTTYLNQLESQLAKMSRASRAFACATLPDAYSVALRTLPIPAGSKIAISGFGSDAAAHAILWAGYKPLFVDVSLETGTIDPASFCIALKDDVHALILTEPFGSREHLDEIGRLCLNHGVHVIEDARYGLGLDHRPDLVHWTIVGFETPSLCPGLSNEAALLTSNLSLAASATEIFAGGATLKGMTVQPSSVSRMSMFSASLIHAKLEVSGQGKAMRENFAAWYATAFSSWAKTGKITLFRLSKENIWPFFPCRVHGATNRDEVVALLRSAGIEAVAPPLMLATQPLFKPWLTGTLPNAERLTRETLFLPLHSELTPKEFEFVLGRMTEWLRGGTRPTLSPLVSSSSHR